MQKQGREVSRCVLLAKSSCGVQEVLQRGLSGRGCAYLHSGCPSQTQAVPTSGSRKPSFFPTHSSFCPAHHMSSLCPPTLAETPRSPTTPPPRQKPKPAARPRARPPPRHPPRRPSPPRPRWLPLRRLGPRRPRLHILRLSLLPATLQLVGDAAVHESGAWTPAAVVVLVEWPWSCWLQPHLQG